MAFFARMVSETLLFVETRVFVFVWVGLGIVAEFNRVYPVPPVDCLLTVGPEFVVPLLPPVLRFSRPVGVVNGSGT